MTMHHTYSVLSMAQRHPQMFASVARAKGARLPLKHLNRPNGAAAGMGLAAALKERA